MQLSDFNNNLNNNQNHNNSNRGGLLSKIIKIVVILVIVYLIFNVVSSLFAKEEPEVIENTPETNTETVTINNYVQNHSVEHNFNTNSNDVNENVATGARAKFTKIKGNGQDEVTVMLYMIGTDLESQYGAATNDLNEIIYANQTNELDNINLVVQTGGCKGWRNNVIENNTRYAINSENLLVLQKNVANTAMTDPNNLTSFIQYAASNFPANRYMLILWDHGGGSVAGYGYDETKPNYPSMSPDLIGQALRNSGVKFDFVGFDACLMANLETAIAIEPYADYLIGSEETEPGGGWYYTNWIKQIANNTSVPTVQLAKTIVDDYIKDSNQSAYGCEITQSVIDLGELVYNIDQPLKTFAQATSKALAGENYQTIANARGNTKEFSKQNRLDQVDLIDLVERFDVEGSDELVKGIKSAIKYNKTANIADSNGLSAYFPYSSLTLVNNMVKIYDNINIDEDYSNVVKSFASYAASGQIVTHNSGSSYTSIFDVLGGNNYYQDNEYSSENIFDILTDAYGGGYGNSYGDNYYGYDSVFGGGYDSWFDQSALDPMSLFFGRSHIVKPSSLDIKIKNNQRVISLENSQWDLIDSVLLNMFVDDGEGYIDLGRDNIFEWNNDGELVVDSDGTWLSLKDGDNYHLVAYYTVDDLYVDDNNYKTTGIIPAYLNDERVNLIVNFTNENPDGIIMGAEKVYADTNAKQKGLIELKDGDQIKFICDYYSYKGEYINEYQLGDIYTVNGELELYNTGLDNNYVYTYCLTDIYGNNLWTPKTEVKK